MIQELEWWHRFRHALRRMTRFLDGRFDWILIHLLVRDPLIERSALGLLALITALLLFKARVVADDPQWLRAIDGPGLARAAGAYGIFFAIWFVALLSHAGICPRTIREHGSRDRALESYRKATGHVPDHPEFVAFAEFFDNDNNGRPVFRALIMALLVSSFLAFLASLWLLIRATSPLLG